MADNFPIRISQDTAQALLGLLRKVRALSNVQTSPGLRASVDDAGVHILRENEMDGFHAQITAMTLVNSIPTYSWTQGDYSDQGALIQLADGLVGDTTANPAYETNGSDKVPIGTWVWMRPGYMAGDNDFAPTDRAYVFDQSLGAGTTVNGYWGWLPDTGITWINGPVVGGNTTNLFYSSVFFYNWVQLSKYLLWVAINDPVVNLSFWWDITLGRPRFRDGGGQVWAVGLQVTNESGLVANGVGSINLLNATGGLTFTIDGVDPSIVHFKQVAYQGCTSLVPGIIGGVPPALATQQKYLLCGDATWEPFTVNAEAVGTITPNSSTSPCLYIAFDDTFFESMPSGTVANKALVTMKPLTVDASTVVLEPNSVTSPTFAIRFDSNFFKVWTDNVHSTQADISLGGWTDGQIPIGNTTGVIPTLAIISKDATMDKTGALTVQGLQGQPIKANVASDAQILIYVGADSKWEATTVTGDVTLAATGDATVTGLQGHTVQNAAPADANLLIYNAGATQWQPHAMTGDAAITNAGAIKVTAVQNHNVIARAPTDARIFLWDNPNTVWRDVAPTGDAVITGYTANDATFEVQGWLGIELDALTMGAPANGNVPTYDSASGKWKAGTGGGGGAAAVQWYTAEMDFTQFQSGSTNVTVTIQSMPAKGVLMSFYVFCSQAWTMSSGTVFPPNFGFTGAADQADSVAYFGALPSTSVSTIPMVFGGNMPTHTGGWNFVMNFQGGTGNLTNLTGGHCHVYYCYAAPP